MKTPVTATAAVTAAMAALALSACGQSGTSDSSTASAAASVSQAPASKGSVAASSDGMMALLPMAAGTGHPVHPAQGHPRRGPRRKQREPLGLAGQGDPAMAAGP